MENLVARAKAMLLTPQTEWKVIDGAVSYTHLTLPTIYSV